MRANFVLSYRPSESWPRGIQVPQQSELHFTALELLLKIIICGRARGGFHYTMLFS